MKIQLTDNRFESPNGLPEEAIFLKLSEPVVWQMAEGILKLTQTDFSLAVSGIAGPSGGTAEKPMGTVWIAIGAKNQSLQSKLFHFRGSRKGIVARAANALMGEFLKLYCSG